MSDKKERKDREKAGIAAKSRLRPIFPLALGSLHSLRKTHLVRDEEWTRAL
jgi:hypothetical protein